MAELVLPLKAEYFNQIKSGEKLEEYRLVTPYWVKRLENREYATVTLTLGYPAKLDTERRMRRTWKGCRRTTITHLHFGPTPVEVFAIDVSEPLQRLWQV